MNIFVIIQCIVWCRKLINYEKWNRIVNVEPQFFRKEKGRKALKDK